MYTVITLNGKGFAFEADAVEEDSEGYYEFLVDGEVVAKFKKDAIAGYFITYLDDEEEYE